jgi:hypothetical protein
MKNLYLAVAASILMVLAFPSVVKSQANLSSSDDVIIDLINPATKEIVYTLTTGLERIVITSSGNFLRTVTFDIEPDHPIMNFSGPRKILEVTIYYDIDGDGIDEVITDTMAVLTKSGNLKFVFLVNGAGNRLPPGWDF